MIKKYRWKCRVLLVKTPDYKNLKYKKAKELYQKDIIHFHKRIIKLVFKKTGKDFSIELFGFDGTKKKIFKNLVSQKIFNIVDQIHPNPFESIKIQPDPPRFGTAFSQLCEHMEQLSIRKSHLFGTAFPFERLSYGRNWLPFVNTFQSKWLSIRNGFGITPKAPLGPSPQRAPKAPLGPPLGPI